MQPTAAAADDGVVRDAQTYPIFASYRRRSRRRLVYALMVASVLVAAVVLRLV
jgi:hypothetical protein